MSHEEPHVPDDGVMVVKVFTEADLADIRMGGEMFDASPDGKAEAERRQAWLDSFSRGTIEISGEWDQS